MKKTLILAAVLALGAALNASASLVLNIVVDEYGNGYLGLPDGQTILGGLGYSTTVSDPYYAAHPNTPDIGLTLSYALDPTWQITAGDIRVDDSSSPIVKSDVFRLTGNRLYVYSDISDIDNPAALGDVGIPISLQQNTVFFAEQNLVNLHPSGLNITAGANGYVWNPTAGQPGFITGAINGVQITGVNYYLISDGVVPEPTTIMFAGVCLLLPFTLRMLRKTRTA